MNDRRDHVAIFRPNLKHLHHKRNVVIGLEPFGHGFAQNRGREGTERFAPFNFRVQNIFDPCISWIGQNGAISQCARPPLHSPLKPTHNFSVGDRASGFFNELFLVVDQRDRATCIRDFLRFPVNQRKEFFVGRSGTKIRSI